MRKPNHIILDFESNNQLISSHYWALNFFGDKNLPIFLNSTYVFRKYNLNKPASHTQKLLNESTKFTLKSNFNEEIDDTLKLCHGSFGLDI